MTDDQSDIDKKSDDFKIEDWIVNKEDFESIDKKINYLSNLSKMYVVKQISTNRECVVKQTRLSLEDKDTKRYFYREIHILATNQHPAIVPFIGYNECMVKKSPKSRMRMRLHGNIYLLRMEKGTLENNIKINNEEGAKDPLWDDNHKFIITFGVACAMEYLHHHNIIHRDLKPENILLDHQLQPYVTDFGTSRDIIIANSIHQTIINTTAYIMAPEFLREADTYKKTLPLDVYAYGITLYILWTGMYPNTMYSDNKYTQEIMAGHRPRIPSETPTNIVNMIERCWSQEPSDRPTFTEIVDELLSPRFSEENQTSQFIQYLKKVESYRPNYIKPSSDTSNSNDKQDQLLPKENNISPETVESSKQPEKPEISDIKKTIENLEEKPSNYESPVLRNLINSTKSGNLSSELDLALALYQGTYGQIKKEEASEHFINVANKSTISSEQSLAEYYYGLCRIENEDYVIAESFLRRSRIHGNPDAAYELARLISGGKIKGKNRDDYYSLLEMAAKNGNIKAIKRFISLLLDPKYNRHSKKLAYDYIRIGSDLGDFSLMHRYSKILEYGMGGLEQKISEAINLLNLLSEFNYPPAQVDLALHLLNGLHIERDFDKAESILEKAANSEDPYGMFWYSQLIANDEEKVEDSIQFLEKSRDSQLVPEAWVVYGQKLIESGEYYNAIDLMFYGMQLGSLSAFISFGKICEIDKRYGDPSFFYELAANHCHAIDECGFYFPLKFNVFHCKNCKVNICEGCAKTCHKNHKIRLISTEFGYNFKCKCGEKGYKIGSSPSCTAESISIYDINNPGINCYYQHLYQCETCCPNTENIYICKSCIENCHKNHLVIDCGIRNGVCSCGLKNVPNHFRCNSCKGSILERKVSYDDCSLTLSLDEPIYQRWFQCLTCGIYGSKNVGICLGCASKCHSDHRVIELGYNKFCCECIKHKTCNYLDSIK